MTIDMFEPSKINMKATAVISECGKYRYKLSRIWDEAKGFVCWIMLNPSAADHKKNDPTINRIIKFSNSWGYGGLVVVNIYPYRSSKPAECKQWAHYWEQRSDWYTRDTIYNENFPMVVEEAKNSNLVIAAFGAADWYKIDADALMDEIQEGIQPYPNIYCIGTTSDGSPKHPLARGKHRVPDNQKPLLWRRS